MGLALVPVDLSLGPLARLALKSSWAGGLAYVCEMSMCELAQVVVWGLEVCACKCALVRAEAVPKLGMCAFVLCPNRDSAQLLFPVW